MSGLAVQTEIIISSVVCFVILSTVVIIVMVVCYRRGRRRRREVSKKESWNRHHLIIGNTFQKQMYLPDVKTEQLQQTPEVNFVKKKPILTEVQTYPPANPPTSYIPTNVKTVSSNQNNAANQPSGGVQAYSKTPYFVQPPGGTGIHENSNPYHMSMSPDMYASAYQNYYYASQEVDPLPNMMLVPFENQTQMVNQIEPSPYFYPMNTIQEEGPYPLDIVPYMPPIEDLQVVEEVEMGHYYYDPYFNDMYLSGSWSSLSSTSTDSHTRSRKRRKTSEKRASKKVGSSKVKGAEKTLNKDGKKEHENSRRQRTGTRSSKIDVSNSKRKSTSHLDQKSENKLSDNYRDYIGHFTNNETSVSPHTQQADDHDNYENRNENETPYQCTYITQMADDRERSNYRNDVTTNYQRYSTSNDANRQARNDVTVKYQRYSTSSDPNRQARNMSYIDRSYLQQDFDMRRRHTRRHSNDGSVILEIPRSYLRNDRYEIPVESTYVDEPRDTMDDVNTGNAFSTRTYSYDVSNRRDESNTDIRVRSDDTNDNQLPQRRFTWQTQTRTSTQPSKLSGVISHVGSYRPDADTWRHKNDRLRPEFVEVQSTTVQIPENNPRVSVTLPGESTRVFSE